MCLNYYAFSCKTNLNRRHAVFLAVFPILWIFSDCRVIRMADSMRGHDENWWRHSPRREDFDWYSTRFKLKTIDQAGVHAKTDLQEQISPNSNVEPSDRGVLPLQRYDWWWMTTSTTEEPYNFDDLGGNSSNNELALYFVLFPFIGIAIFIICKYHLCEDRSCAAILCRECCDEPLAEERSSSRRTQNRRRAPITSFVNHSFSAEADRPDGRGHSSRPQISLARSLNGDRFTPSSVSGGSQNNTRALDKPPGYSDVIMADFSVGPAHFPEVNPRIPDSPPPVYDEGNMKY